MRLGAITRVSLTFIPFLAAWAPAGYAEEGKWTTKAEMPTARAVFSTSVVAGKIYAIGGSIDTPPFQTAIVEEYDTGFSEDAEVADFKAKVVLSGKKLRSDGFELGLTGEIGRTYRLQASTTLAVGSWIDLVALTLTQATTNFLDTAAANLPQRFYRLVSP